MKIGYPCINLSLGCTTNSTFRLKNYSEENLKIKVKNNLECLFHILKFNLKNNIFFFRISSDIVPFASHPICNFNWQKYFQKDFEKIGHFIKKNDIRVSMHPDQFVILNSQDRNVVKRSIMELDYHSDVLELLGVDKSAKIQIHVGGVYGNREKSIERFIKNYENLSDRIKKRLVIENDDRSYPLKDCLKIYSETGIPVVFDVFHHQCLNDGEDLLTGIKQSLKTWKKDDGKLMVDYSTQSKNGKKCSHTNEIDENDFKNFLLISKNYDFDIMLEIKNKEKSALKAIKILKDVRYDKTKDTGK